MNEVEPWPLLGQKYVRSTAAMECQSAIFRREYLTQFARESGMERGVSVGVDCA
jgi:hypothetical protein